jgi:phosphoglycerate dehydrogenase-like enzyme
MNTKSRVAVCSRSFSKNPLLRAELLTRYAHVTFNETGEVLLGDKLINFLNGHHKAITALEVINDDLLTKLPELQVISKYGVGLDSIDIAAVAAHGRRLGWTGGVNRRSVSELVIAFAISMLRHIPVANSAVKMGAWNQLVGGQLTGRTVGIVGCGHIGKDLVSLLKPFGCKILVNDILNFEDFYIEHSLLPVKLDELLANADIVTLHVPLTTSTKGMLGANTLRLMKHNAVLINTARGGLVDEAALKSILKGGHIAAAAFDVFADEPPEDIELLSLPNFLATPHIGGSSQEAILAMGRAAIDGLDNNCTPTQELNN